MYVYVLLWCESKNFTWIFHNILQKPEWTFCLTLSICYIKICNIYIYVIFYILIKYTLYSIKYIYFVIWEYKWMKHQWLRKWTLFLPSFYCFVFLFSLLIEENILSEKPEGSELFTTFNSLWASSSSSSFQSPLLDLYNRNADSKNLPSCQKAFVWKRQR